MPNRQTVDAIRYTLTVGGASYSGFLSSQTPDHDRQTGRVSPSGASGDVVTVGSVRKGGVHTLTKQYDPDEWESLQAAIAQNPEASLVGHIVDPAGVRVGQAGRYTGVVSGATLANLNTDSAEALTTVIRFAADGDLG